MKIRNSILSILVLLSSLLYSCGKESDEVQAAISEAHFLLTDKDCAGARSALDKVGYQATNAEYIGAYASTYACSANYSTITLFGTDIDKFSSDVDGIFGSLALFSTSDDMTSATDPDFTNLQAAINTILYAGGQSASSSANRETVFSIRENTNLNVQALYMILVNLGRWFHFYGNPDDAGTKGAGPGTNTCLFTYSDPYAIAGISAGETGSCTNAANQGSSDMMTGDPAQEKERLCHGIVMLTNFIDLIANIEFSGDDVGDLSSAGDSFEEACDFAADEGYDFCSVRDQSSCEAQDIADLEAFSVLVFESNFK